MVNLLYCSCKNTLWCHHVLEYTSASLQFSKSRILNLKGPVCKIMVDLMAEMENSIDEYIFVTWKKYYCCFCHL